MSSFIMLIMSQLPSLLLQCDAYWNHDIAGKLCVNLCDAKRPLYLASYTVHRHGHRVRRADIMDSRRAQMAEVYSRGH